MAFSTQKTKLRDAEVRSTYLSREKQQLERDIQRHRSTTKRILQASTNIMASLEQQGATLPQGVSETLSQVKERAEWVDEDYDGGSPEGKPDWFKALHGLKREVPEYCV
uniref:Tubulin-specific chaperone A n=3 Tax=Hemiselmis andersenii TaxID=464988 RepID=A0A7S1H694_HEMAN